MVNYRRAALKTSASRHPAIIICLTIRRLSALPLVVAPVQNENGIKKQPQVLCLVLILIVDFELSVHDEVVSGDSEVGCQFASVGVHSDAPSLRNVTVN